MNYILIILSFLAGALLTLIVTVIMHHNSEKKKTFGNIIINSDMEKDLFNFEFEKNPIAMAGNKKVIFRIKNS